MLNKVKYLSFVVILVITTTNSFAQDFGCYSAPSASGGGVLDGMYMRESIKDFEILTDKFFNDYQLETDSSGYFTYYYNTLCPNVKQIQMDGMLINGKRTGLWNFYIFNTKYRISGNFVDDKKQGVWKAYYLNEKGDSTYSQISEFKDDVLDGTTKYYRDGILYKIANYSKGLKYGKTITYCDSHIFQPFCMNTEQNYVTGVKDGDFIKYNLSDTVEYLHYENGKLNGTCFYNGHKTMINYKEGKIEGKLQNYHANGILMLEIEFRNNLPYNVIVNNDSTGKPYDTCRFINGTGALCLYYPDGTLESYYNYENQILKGDFQRFYDDGSLMEDGNILYCKGLKDYDYSPNDLCYDMNLNLTRGFYNYVIDKWHWYDENQNGYQYSECIDSSQSGFYIERIFDVSGKCTYQNFRYIDSSLYKSVNFNYLDTSMVLSRESLETLIINSQRKTVRQGLCLYYYPSGGIKAEINLKDGEEIPVSKYYDESGNLIRIYLEDENGQYSIFNKDTVNLLDKNGLKQGKWIGFYHYSFYNQNCSDSPNWIEYYKDNKPVGIWESYSLYSIINDLESTTQWITETISYQKEYFHGKLSGEGHLNNNLKDGEWKIYNYKNNRLGATGLYFLGQRYGAWTTYKRNGKTIKSISYYEFDKLVYFSGKKNREQKRIIGFY